MESIETAADLRQRQRLKRIKVLAFRLLKNKYQVGSLLAVGMGFIVGLVVRSTGSLSKTGILVMKFPGQLMINLLQLICIPLIVPSVIAGVAGMSKRASRKVAKRVLGFVIGSTIMGLTLGLILVLLIEPGVYYAEIGEEVERPMYSVAFVRDILRNLVPRNLILACVSQFKSKVDPVSVNNVPVAQLKDTTLRGSNIMGLIAWSIVFGLLLDLSKQSGKTIIEIIFYFNEGTKSIISVVLRYIPIGLFFMVVGQILEIDWETLQKLALFTVIVLSGLFIHAFIVMPLVYFVIARNNPYIVVRKVYPAVLTAFFISSSTATLPQTLRCCEKHLEIDKRVTRFILPVITAVNINGTTLYEIVATIFITQMNGANVGFSQLLTLSLVTVMLTVGASGIPKVGGMTTFFILSTAGFPVNNYSLLMATEWLLDRFCSAVNVLANCFGVAMIHQITSRHIATPEEPDESEDVLNLEDIEVEDEEEVSDSFKTGTEIL